MNDNTDYSKSNIHWPLIEYSDGTCSIQFDSIEGILDLEKWHSGCKGKTCLTELAYAELCLENCGGFIP